MADDRVEVREDVVYGTGNGRDLRCDLYLPPGDESRRGAVLLVHGGGWRHGDKNQLRGYGLRLGRSGYLCVATEYRLVGESPWPAQVHDVKAVLRWMRANADELGIDSHRIALQGASAGAHIVLFAAATPNVAEFEGDGGNPGVDTTIDAVIAAYPPTLFHYGERLHGAVPIEALSDDPTAQLAQAASPLHLVGPSFPPTMLVHGSEDKVVPVSASFVMYEALVRHNVPTDLHVFAGAVHGFDAELTFGRRTAELVLLFLERYLKTKAAATA